MTTSAETRPAVAVYNPDLLSKEDLIAGFVARQPLLDHLLDDLRREGPAERPQHHLIVGQRGFGKTTLLRRLAYGVQDDSELVGTWLSLVFPEDQYNVSDLGDLWVNCLDALGNALENAGDAESSRALDHRLSQLPVERDRRRAAALELLVSEAEHMERRLLLLIDNLDIVLDRLNDQQEWELRRIVSEQNRLLIIGSSTRPPGTVYEYGRAFYDFFRIHELKGLNDQETLDVLRQLAGRAGRKDVLRVLNEQKGRVRTMRHLSGGNPRTLVLLFRVLAGNPEGDIQRDVEQLLDLYTPLYKARVEELAAQALKVVDAMAVRWDPVTAADLAAETLLPVNQVSTQLKRLEDDGVVEKAPWFGESKTAFQIAERFFNIWYLMRASRRVRRRLIWLVRFLDAWFGEEELETRGRELLHKSPDDIGRDRYAATAFAYAQTIRDRRLRTDLEDAALYAIEPDRIRELIDLADLPAEVRDRHERNEHHFHRYREAGQSYLDGLRLDPSQPADSLLSLCERLAESAEDGALSEELARAAHELRPRDIRVTLVLAGILILRGNAYEGKNLMRPLAADENLASPPSLLPFRAFVQTRQIQDCLALLEETGADQRWRPVSEALRASKAGSAEYLNRIAPEVRTVAQEILRLIAPDLATDGQKVARKRGRRRARR